MYKVMFTLTLVTTVIIGSVYAVDAYNHDMNVYKQSSECVSKYISQGIERKDIVINGSTCWVRK